MSLSIKPADTVQERLIGVRYSEELNVRPQSTHLTFIASDLSRRKLDLRHATQCTFVGCLVDELELTSSPSTHISFKACFSESESPVRTGLASEVQCTRSYLTLAHAQGSVAINELSPEELRLFRDMVALRNDVRHTAVKAMGDSLSPDLAPLLACAILDVEWDVSWAALDALPPFLAQNPKYAVDLEMLMFSCLGDDEGPVRWAAQKLVVARTPPPEPLQPTLEQLSSDDPERALRGILAAGELVRVAPQYTALVMAQQIGKAAHSPDPDVRAETMTLMGIVDTQDAWAYLAEGLRDDDQEVVLSALKAIERMGFDYPQGPVRDLLVHADGELRYAALRAIYFSFRSTPEDAQRMLSDPSPDVQRLAARMISDAAEPEV